ncbi:hypothetical protein [Chitinophaga sp. HK235]|uniref:hypothetical protein n=1 Tax=Chitinophaga sp. HK235 TaxID=2952571 RepID=UPI001BA8C7DE|nr:hypothetical protein [Chitinophaga sp. HK235]
MRYFFLCLSLLLLQHVAKAQLLYPYKDTTYNFSIGIPEKWQYWAKPDSPIVKFMVYDMSMDDSGMRVHNNFNISVINHPGLGVDSAFIYMAYATAKNRLQALDTGSYVVDGKKMLWLDDAHLGVTMKDTLCASYFVVYSNNKVYLITCSTTPLRFSESRELFHRVAQTFKTDLPAPQEVLQIDFPKNRVWQINMETDDSTMHLRQVLPVDETPDQWTMAISSIAIKNPKQESMENFLTQYQTQIAKESKGAKFTLLEKTAQHLLFKIENTGAESSLSYLVRGTSRLHQVILSIKQETLPAETTKQWTEIFKKAKPVME